MKPAVEKEALRTVYMATHTDAQLDRALEIFQRCGRELGLIPYEKPHTRVEVKMARPGVTGFFSADQATGQTTAGGSANSARLELSEVLLGHSGEPFGRRLSQAAEILTWRAVNARREDVQRLAKLPKQLWMTRRRLPVMLMSAGMELVSRRLAKRSDSSGEEG